MKMKPFGMSALALLGALLLGTGQVQASETLNTILGGGAGGVAGTMIGKELGGDTGALVIRLNSDGSPETTRWKPLFAAAALRPSPTLRPFSRKRAGVLRFFILLMQAIPAANGIALSQ